MLLYDAIHKIDNNSFIFFFFNDTATTEIYTLSLHDALPIRDLHSFPTRRSSFRRADRAPRTDRKSTRLNSSHVRTSYAVFCLKKKKIKHLVAPVPLIDARHPGGPTRPEAG